MWPIPTWCGIRSRRYVSRSNAGIEERSHCGGPNIPVMPSMAPIAEVVYGPDVIGEFAIPDFTALNDGSGEQR